MTVKELIEKLQEMPPEAEVTLDDGWSDEWPLTEVNKDSEITVRLR